MGFSSNQWLNRGEGLRDRGYRPVSATINAEAAGGNWCEEHKVVVEITATNANDQHQVFLLKKLDAEKCAPIILGACGGKVRERVAVQVLKSMSAATLLKTLTAILRSRMRDQPKK